MKTSTTFDKGKAIVASGNVLSTFKTGKNIFVVNNAMIGKKSNSMTPSFLLTFETFNMSVHNFLVDSGTSSNIMPYDVCKRLNAEPQKSATQTVQFDCSNVKVMGELKDAIITLASNLKSHQVIDIIAVDIPKSYELVSSRDWSSKINNYFMTNWSHLWIPNNSQPNNIWVNQERYMKYVITELSDVNEPMMFNNSILGNYCFDTYFDTRLV